MQWPESPAATSRTGRMPAKLQRRRAAPTTSPSGTAGSASLFLRHNVARRDDAQHVDAAAVGTQNLECQPTRHERLAAPRQPAEIVHRQAADRVELLVAELGAEERVELIDARLRLHRELALAFLADVEIVLDVVLVAD